MDRTLVVKCDNGFNATIRLEKISKDELFAIDSTCGLKKPVYVSGNYWDWFRFADRIVALGITA